MHDGLVADAVARGDDPRLRAVLEEVWRSTGMGFAVVARVTEERWITCQVLDKIEFGLEPGGELAIMTTIRDDIRRCGEAVVLDDIDGDPTWRTHPSPALYGFKSYASLPLYLADGSFFGTLCAIDPAPHDIGAPPMLAALQGYARRAAAILSA